MWYKIFDKIVGEQAGKRGGVAGKKSSSHNHDYSLTTATYERIIEMLDLGIIVLDANQCVKYRNPAFCHIIGSNNDCAQLGLDDIFDHEDCTFIRVFLLSSGQGESRQIETSIVPSSLTEENHLPVLVNIYQLQDYAVISLQNISERRNTELSLQKQNVRTQNIIDIYSDITGKFLNCITRYEVLQNLDDALRRIVNHASIDVYSSDQNGKYVLEYTAKSVAGTGFLPDTDKMKLAIGILARKKRPVIITDFSGQLDQVELDAMPVLREHDSAVILPMFQGAVVSSVIVMTFDMIFPVTDIFTQNIIMGIANLATMTLEKIGYYFEQERIRTAFDRHERLVAMGHLIAGVAHEINNPLSIMQLDLDELRSHYNSLSNPDSEALIDSMQEEIQRMSGLVRQLKDFARNDENDEVIDDQSTDINEIFKSYPIKIMLKNISRKKIAIKQDLKAGRCNVIIPRNKLLQVVINLLVNAEEALVRSEKGIIKVSTWFVENDDKAGTGTGFIAIRDNGPGIGSECMHRIFDPFFTTKQATGTGLGLSISYTIITAHGGGIWAESEQENGTSFIISLPAVKKKSMLSQFGRTM